MSKHIPSKPAEQCERATWTPGPWRRDTRAIVCRQILAGPKDNQASVAVVSTDSAAWEANARLIALAPRMAEALRDVFIWWSDSGQTMAFPAERIRAILAELEDAQ